MLCQGIGPPQTSWTVIGVVSHGLGVEMCCFIVSVYFSMQNFLRQEANSSGDLKKCKMNDLITSRNVNLP